MRAISLRNTEWRVYWDVQCQKVYFLSIGCYSIIWIEKHEFIKFREEKLRFEMLNSFQTLKANFCFSWFEYEKQCIHLFEIDAVCYARRNLSCQLIIMEISNFNKIIVILLIEKKKKTWSTMSEWIYICVCVVWIEA
jgi:hypothetical protein